MNRNSEFSFSSVPSVDKERSRFDRSHSFKFSGKVGDVIPVFCDPDILPGDTVVMDTSKVIRFQTLLSPVMDNIHADFYWFFVPHRLVWDHWQEFMGENNSSAWIPNVEYTTPKLVVPPTSGVTNVNHAGTILDYLGYPVASAGQTENVKINALPVRAYSLICDQWFRSENLTDPLNIYKGDADVTATHEESYINDVPHGGYPFKAAKDFDYFTSCLPSPQKGPSVTLPLGDKAPVGTFGNNVNTLSSGFNNFAFRLKPRLSTDVLPTGVHNVHLYRASSDTTGSGALEYQQSTISNPGDDHALVPANLYADLSQATASTIADLRIAFQMQRYYEQLARTGSRYIEIIKGFFGVDSPDSRLQRAEYLGGNRVPIVVDQVTNQAGASGDLGELGAFSRTTDYHSDFTHSFVEHGTLMCVMVVRYDHSYSQGVPRFFMRDTKFDYFWPTFAHISEQPVDKSQLYVGASGTFGYNEAWADYRYFPNRLAGYMRPYLDQSLSSWTLGDDYESAPSLSDGWIREESNTVNRILAVSDQASGFQFFADMYFNTQYTRPMPLYSVPGLKSDQ